MKLFNSIRNISLTILCAIVISGCASTGEKTVAVHGKPILVVDVDKAFLSDEEKISLKKTPKVYVKASDTMGAPGLMDEGLSNADKIIRAVFDRKGFTTVDNPNDADIAIAFQSSVAFSMRDAENAASASILNDGGSKIGATATRIGVFGAPVALAAQILTLGSADKVLLSGSLFKSPKVGESRQNRPIIKDTAGLSLNMTNVKYKIGKNSKGEEASMAEVLDVVIGEWVNRYVVE